MDYILTADSLSKHYRHFKALDGFSIHVPKGAIYGFIGKNGAGKTTLIRLICGLQEPTEGSYTLYGKKNTDPGITKCRRRMGAVVETPSIYLDMTAQENLKEQYRIIGLPSFDDIPDLLHLVGLDNTGKKKVKHFSLGMKQRLGIAIALAESPDFIVLDEPINGLDPQGIIELRELILKLNRERQITFLISSSTAGLIFCLSYLTGALLVGVPLTGIEEGTLQGIVILVLLSLLMSGAFTALCTITALLCQNRALTVVINILSACFLLVMSIYVMNKLLEPETYMGTYLDTSTGKVTAGEEIKNPDYLEGTERDIYQFFNDFLPTGQSVNIAQAGGVSGNPGLMAAYSAGIIIVSTGIGIFSFKKRDIK